MWMEKCKSVECFMEGLKKRNPNQTEFHQAVEEFVTTVMPYVIENPKYIKNQILERMTEPDRVISFRVTWRDDKGQVRVNRAWRVQFNNSIGPYKGGLRFHPTVTLSVLKFLGFEQIFKNSLTGLPMGGGKGGSNFNPKGKSDNEVMSFCQSMMSELYRHIGPDKDVPAGDIGVGAREVSYLYGQYKRLQNEFHGVLTGKGLSFGGSKGRTEATGYGCVYFCKEVLDQHDEDIKGKKVVISGSGNVATYAAEKAMQMGAKVLTLSDSSGFIYEKDGLTQEKLDYIKELKDVRRGRLSEYAEEYSSAEYHEGKKPWSVKCDVALPCATQNEISLDDAKELTKNGVKVVCEGANMPTELDAMKYFMKEGVLFGPAKAANAGGVAVSGLEQSQNALRMSWSKEEVDAKLVQIMKDIHGKCVEYGDTKKLPNKNIDYVTGANIGGFIKVADAMVAFGAV